MLRWGKKSWNATLELNSFLNNDDEKSQMDYANLMGFNFRKIWIRKKKTFSNEKKSQKFMRNRKKNSSFMRWRLKRVYEMKREKQKKKNRK